MRCENRYCIYWEEESCVLDEISLDYQGQCSARILVAVDDEILERERRRLLILYGED